jgi:hypothetical protein
MKRVNWPTQLRLSFPLLVQLNAQSMVAGLLVLFFSLFAFYGPHPLQTAFWLSQIESQSTSESEESEDSSEASEKVIKAAPLTQRRLIASLQLQVVSLTVRALLPYSLKEQFVFAIATRAGPLLRAPPTT